MGACISYSVPQATYEANCPGMYSMAESALSDLRVLELGEFVSAAWCTRAFAVMGAEVI